jgi:hypothetical protein
MTMMSIALFDEDNPARATPPWAHLAHPTHHATTSDGAIEAVVIARGMASGRPSVALRAEFPAPPAFPHEEPVVAVFELSIENLQGLLGAALGMEASS